MKQEGCGIFYKSRQEACIIIFEYIESYYNLLTQTEENLNQLHPFCTCQKEIFHNSPEPLFRLICHCQTCQAFLGMDYNDECTFFRSDFPDVNLQQIEFQRSGSPLSPIQRGRCLACGKVAFCIAKLGPFLELLMVPSQMLGRETLPDAYAEVYFHRRVLQTTENTASRYTPQISGHFLSQVTILRAVLTALFKSGIGFFFQSPQKKVEEVNIQWICKDECQNLSKKELVRLKSLFVDSPLLHYYPAKSNVNIQIEIRKRIPIGSQILNATIWNLDHIHEVTTPAGFPRATVHQFAERELLLVEILHITQKIGGMGSYYGYIGYYYSVIVDLIQDQILDVRGEKMS